MKLAEFCLKRKVTVAMLYIVVMLLGVIAWVKLPKEFMPNLEFPQLTVITAYSHASSQEVENLVTKVVEEAASTVRGVRRVHSISREGVSFVTVEFGWGVNMDFASLNLREKIDLAKGKLPKECNEPRIERFNPFALPVLMLSVSGNRPAEDLLEMARRPAAEMLEKAAGVAQVSLMGGRERQIKVELEKNRLGAHALSILDVVDALAKSNITFPSGVVKDEVFEYTVRIVGVFKQVSDISKVALNVQRRDVFLSKRQSSPEQQKNANLVTIEMLGTVEDDFKDPTSYSRYDGKDTISLSVLKQGEAFVVDVADACKRKLVAIRDRLPRDVKLAIVYDQSTYINQGIKDLVHNGLEGGVLALIVIFIFLGSIFDALVVCVSMPVSILAALFLMYAKGITINTISLAGLILGIGKLVDASIVVQENIARNRHAGFGVYESVTRGTREVISSVVGSVLTNIVVFLPLIFVPGIIGQVFNDLSWSIIFALVASLVVSFTLIPLLASLMTKPHSEMQWWRTSANKISPFVEANYKRILFFCFRNYRCVLGAFAVVSVCAVAVLLFYVEKETFPPIAETQFLIKVDMPVGTKLEVTNRVAHVVEERLLRMKQVRHCSVTVGSIANEGVQLLGQHQAQIVVEIYETYKHSLDELMEQIRQRMTTSSENREDLRPLLEGARLSLSRQGGTLGALARQGGDLPGQGKPVVIEIKGYDLADMESVARGLQKQLKTIHGITDSGTSISVPGPEMRIEVNKDVLASYNLTVSKVAETVLTAVKGKVATKFREEGKEVDILVRLQEQDTKNIDELGSLLIASPLGIDVPLSAVATIHTGEGPSEIVRIDQERTIMVFASLAGVSLEHVTPAVENFIHTASQQKPQLSILLTGESETIKSSYTSLIWILVLSILFVYMVMASEFESLWKPFLILFTIPMSLIGIVPSLLISGHKLSVMTGMGIVLIAGIVVDNGIVLIDFVHDDDKNLSPENILFNACIRRLRPIVMTACATVMALIPLMLNLRGNADMQAPMATVVVWGLVVSTILTLFILPTMFYVVEKRKIRRV